MYHQVQLVSKILVNFPARQYNLETYLFLFKIIIFYAFIFVNNRTFLFSVMLVSEPMKWTK